MQALITRCARGAARTIAGMIWAAATLAMVADLLLMSGFLESRALPRLSEFLFGARVHCWVDGWRPLRLRALRVYDEAALPDTPPLLKADAVTIAYQLRATAELPRYFPLLDVWGIHLHIDGREPELTNYGFLSAVMGEGQTTDDVREITAWIPARLVLRDCSIHAARPEWTARIAGLDVEAGIESIEQFRATISGAAVRGGWRWGAASDTFPMPEGDVAAILHRNGDEIDFSGNVHLPDFMRLDGAVRVLLASAPELAVDINDFSVDGPVFGHIFSTVLPVSVRFDAAAIAPLRFHVVLDKPAPLIADAQVDMRVENLRIGPEDAPWYAGPLRVAASGEHGLHSKATLTAVLNHNQEITGEIASGPDAPRVALAFDGWKHEQLLALWPVAWEAWTPWLPEFKRLDASVSAVIDNQNEDILFAADARLETTTTRPATIELSGVSSFAGNIEGQSLLSMGDGTIAATVARTVGEGAVVDVVVNTLALSEVSGLLFPAFQDVVQAVVDGVFQLNWPDGGDYTYTARITSPSPVYGDYALPEQLSPLVVVGSGEGARDFSWLHLQSLDIAMSESATIAISDYRFNMADMKAEGACRGSIDLTSLGVAIGYDELWGTLEFSGTLRQDGFERLTIAPFTTRFDPIGYGNHAIPYGMVLEISAPVVLDRAPPMGLRAGPALATLGADTRLNLDVVTLSFTDGPVVTAPSLHFETGFAPLLAGRYLAAAEGQLEISGRTLGYDASGARGEATYRCTASRLALPNNLAVLQGVSLEGALAMAPVLGTEGRLRIVELLAGGVVVQGLQSKIMLDDDLLIMDDIVVDLFGGGVNARAEVRPFTAGTPLMVRGEARNLDLSIFTQEFEPPSLVLTGRVNGDFAVGVADAQLSALDVDLEAREGFSMNRDMVEQLLMSQYMDDVAGGRQMSRMLRSVIGDKPLRPFDRAQLKLGLEDMRIAGYARLESDALNLTVDIKADPPALLEALRIRQQQVE